MRSSQTYVLDIWSLDQLVVTLVFFLPTQVELFHVQKDPDAPTLDPAELDDSSRFIQYDFGAKFLTYKTIGTK